MNVNNVVKQPKKRGRKPKGGKLISNIEIDTTKSETYTPNIILHLRCKSSSISQPDTSGYDSNIESYDNVENDSIINNKNIWEKLKILNKELHQNNIRPTNTCFWDTCDFNNTPCYLPIEETQQNINVYGCFCSPACAVAYLFNEQCDSSTKWERYSLLNKIYKKIYNYDKNIKPAPDPRYLLNKYFGNLTVEEYRLLNSNNSKQLIVINKPITIITPELYETNNELSNIKSHVKTKNIFK